MIAYTKVLIIILMYTTNNINIMCAPTNDQGYSVGVHQLGSNGNYGQLR